MSYKNKRVHMPKAGGESWVVNVTQHAVERYIERLAPNIEEQFGGSLTTMRVTMAAEAVAAFEGGRTCLWFDGSHKARLHGTSWILKVAGTSMKIVTVHSAGAA